MHKAILPFLAITTLHAEPDFHLQPSPGKLLSPAINEASGLAISLRSENFLWIINDSGGTNEIHLSNTDGTPRGSIKLKGVKNKDWEDLCSFTYKGNPYLLVADTGDNNSKRDSVNLFIVQEPPLPSEGLSLSGESEIAWKINFTYENDPRDCEAVAVDSKAGKIILISKRTDPPEIYELPLRPSTAGIQTAKQTGTTKVIAPVLSFLPHRNQPTGLDISNDASMATIVTYYGVFVFKREHAQTWAEAFAEKPGLSGSHKLPQAESVAFSNDGKSIFSVSEGMNSPIVIYR